MIITGLILACIFALGLRHISGSDTYWHIATGKYVLSNLSIPRFDPFTFTMADTPWRPTEWLSEAIMFLTFKAGGFPGIVIFTSAAFTAVFLILFLHSCSTGALSLATLSILALVGIDRIQHCIPRPQIFSYILLSYFSFSIHQYLSGRSKTLWHLPFLVLLWVNLHAGALNGLLLLAIVLAAETIKNFFGSHVVLEWKRLRHIGAVFLTSCLSLALNPNGYGLITWVISHPGINKAVQNLEFLSMSFSDPMTRMGLILMCIMAVSMAVNWKSLDLRDILTAAAFLPPALYMRRAGAEFFIVTFPAFARYSSLGMEMVFSRFNRKTVPVLSIMVPLLILACMAAWRLSDPRFINSLGFGVDPAYYPKPAISFVMKSSNGPIFNSIMFGGALILEAYPEKKAFWDTRLHGDEMYLAAIRRIKEDPVRFKEFIESYGIETCLVEAELKGLSRDFFPRKRWALVYWDDWALVFVRRSGMNAEAIEKYEYREVDPVSIVPPAHLLTPAILLSLEKELQRAVEENPSSGRALFALGQIAARQGQLDEAIEKIRMAIEINPTLASAYNTLGTFLARKGDISGAKDAFKEALKWNPWFAMSHTNLGILYAGQRMHNEALGELERALKINPMSPETHLYLGITLLSLNRNKEARFHLSESLRLDPHQERANDIQRLIMQIEGK